MVGIVSTLSYGKKIKPFLALINGNIWVTNSKPTELNDKLWVSNNVLKTVLQLLLI